jgi:hypothetical protein
MRRDVLVFAGWRFEFAEKEFLIGLSLGDD